MRNLHPLASFHLVDDTWEGNSLGITVQPLLNPHIDHKVHMGMNHSDSGTSACCVCVCVCVDLALTKTRHLSGDLMSCGWFVCTQRSSARNRSLPVGRWEVTPKEWTKANLGTPKKVHSRATLRLHRQWLRVGVCLGGFGTGWTSSVERMLPKIKKDVTGAVVFDHILISSQSIQSQCLPVWHTHTCVYAHTCCLAGISQGSSASQLQNSTSSFFSQVISVWEQSRREDFRQGMSRIISSLVW